MHEHEELIKKCSIAGSKKRVFICNVKSRLGDMTALADGDCLYLLQFQDGEALDKKVQQVCTELGCELVGGSNKLLKQLQHELDEYFDGNLKKFTIPIRSFGSDFHKEVWSELLNIPFGETKSYSEHAQAMGRGAGHARAVGTACGANPHVLLVPCHRIVARGGQGGYGAGAKRKTWLLEHEKGKQFSL